MTKCPYCGKTVYFAERQICEGKEFHGVCARNYLKDKKEQDGGAAQWSGGKNYVGGSTKQPEKAVEYSDPKSADYMKRQIEMRKEEVEKKKEEQKKKKRKRHS